MMELKTKDKSFTFPSLSVLVDLLIGDSESCVIPKKYKLIAELLELAAKDTYICAIQWEDENGIELSSPKLWRFQRWRDSVERWKRQKERSERERVERFIFQANVKLVAAACVKEFYMDETFAEATAFSIMKEKNLAKIKFLGVTLIESESEL